MKKVLFWLSLLTLSTLSLLPSGYLPPQAFSLWDKAQHALGFAGLTVLALWAYPGAARKIPWWLLIHGAAIELAQAATGWRQGDWLDWLADAIGILAGMLTMLIASRIARSSS